jgi:hypothetical protein
MKKIRKTEARRAQTAVAREALAAKRAEEQARYADEWAALLNGVPGELPEPEPVENGEIGAHNLAIAEAMARCGSDLDQFLDYLAVERSDLNREALEDLASRMRRWRAEARHTMQHAILETARSSSHVGDRKLAASLFEEPEEAARDFEGAATDHRAKLAELLAKAWDESHPHVKEKFKACPTCGGSGQTFREAPGE